jgi:CBS domain-containing protein
MTDVMDVGATPILTLTADDVARVAPEATLIEVAEELTARDVGALAVGPDDGHVRGVVSERDLVRALADGRDPATTRAIGVCHTTLVWCDSTATVAEVAVLMMEEYVRHVLVERDGQLVGIISARDLLGAYAGAHLAED